MLTITNPATGDLLAAVPVTTAEAVAEAAARARAAQRGWAARSFAARRQVLLGARASLARRRREIVEALVAETGKPRVEAYQELLAVADAIGYFSRQAPKVLARRRVRSTPLLTKKVFLAFRPHGVVGVITPWNFPVLLSFADAVPALVAGNAVLVKPSEWTPLAVGLVGDALVEGGLPRDLLCVLPGTAATGEALVDVVDAVSFTGSTAGGRKVAERAGSRLVPVTLELGGKDPMIVLRDADLERAAHGAVFGAMLNSGQVCVGVERVYVEEPVADEFLRRVVDEVRGLRQGAPDGAIDIGAITIPKQLRTIEAHVADALENGARVLVGGKRRSGTEGRFFEPTVLTDVHHDMRIMREETFGPVLPVMTVDSADEAIRLANDSPYGLSSSVWTANARTADEVAERLEAGSTVVNDCLIAGHIYALPFGGIKDSGIGFKHGPEGLRKFCVPHSIVVDRFGPRREPSWFPYRDVQSTILDALLRFVYGFRPRGSRPRH